MQPEYIDGSTLYQDFLTDSQTELQTGQLPTDMFTFGGLPTYPISQLTNQQQSQPYIDDSNLIVHEHLLTNSIGQQNDSPYTRQSLLTHRHQRQQQWLSQYPYSRQRANELFTPTMRSDHRLDPQNPFRGTVPAESSESIRRQKLFPVHLSHKEASTKFLNYKPTLINRETGFQISLLPRWKLMNNLRNLK
ncbi:11180_t:CDS:2 [Paraglomus occultum]|uniref:11180_t:CDS:1 n=1 Tax=Paraglomus occultum TaxID=144539 RepID=A0A9N8Z765_9GLOM|nr:11180_t:CDS:2 [Paraglomus occultum]